MTPVLIRAEAGMSTTRFCQLIDMPGRTSRRRQSRTIPGRPAKGPWPRPARTAAADPVAKHALAHPAWGHRKIWAMVRHDGHVVPGARVLRLLREEGPILPAAHQSERRNLPQHRKAAFAWAADQPEPAMAAGLLAIIETTAGGTWRIAGCRDYWSKYEHRWHIWPTANQHDAIDAIELALADYEEMFGHPLAAACQVDPDTGEMLPALTIVTYNAGPIPLLAVRGVHRAAPASSATCPRGCPRLARTAPASAAPAHCTGGWAPKRSTTPPP